MRIVFAGTPEFAATALSALLAAGQEVSLVLTQPDRPSGRGLQPQPSAVKKLALAHSLALSQPASLRDPSTQLALRAQRPDAMVVAAYGLILPPAVLDIPRLGAINIHASLLPRWRGAAPIQRAIMAGDEETGVCIMQMDAGLDTGPVLLRRALPIAADDTAASLHDKLASLGASAIVEALTELEHGAPRAEPQPSVGITYAAKITKEEARVDWSQEAVVVERKIRALNPAPVAVTQFRGEPVRIWRARVRPELGGSPGEILKCQDDELVVACGYQALDLLEVQRAGGRRIPARDWIAGARPRAGEMLGT